MRDRSSCRLRRQLGRFLFLFSASCPAFRQLPSAVEAEHQLAAFYRLHSSPATAVSDDCGSKPNEQSAGLVPDAPPVRRPEIGMPVDAAAFFRIRENDCGFASVDHID